jgi:ubiquitin carboxyl-terminal hydrolase 7
MVVMAVAVASWHSEQEVSVCLQGTTVENIINKLFEGHILKYIECINVDYKSAKRDSYMDIFLDVRGCKNIYESFDKLTAEERLEGNNQYNAEGHGLQV